MRARIPRLALPVLAAGALLEAPVDAQQVEPELQRQIDRAIDRGIDFLLGTQLLDGSWGYLPREYVGGHTALCTYALIESGVSPEHPAVRGAFAYLAAHEPQKTYSISCLLLALGETGDARHHDWMERLADALLDFETSGGLFEYPDHPLGHGEDLSNTLFAALGLRAAAEAGVKVPSKTWQRLIRAAESCQEPERSVGRNRRKTYVAGFGYRPGEPAYGSMTTAGVSILAIAAEQLGSKLGGSKRRGLERRVELGTAWLAHHWSLGENPRLPGSKWHYYHLYGLERVGSLNVQDTIGDHAWYAEGASFLVMEQKPWGGWEPLGEAVEAEVDSCLALLFLNRATARRAFTGDDGGFAGRRRGVAGRDDPSAEVSLRASGDTPLTLWLSSFGGSLGARREAGDGTAPTIATVRYRGVEKGGSAEPQELGVVVAGTAAAGDDDRFAIQVELPTRGRWELWAEVSLAERDGSVTEVVSTKVLVEVRDVLEPWRLAYGSDEERNLLADVEVEAEASSHDGPRFPARAAADRLLGRAWRCERGDAQPVLTLRWRKSVKADTILLSHADNKRLDRGLPRVAVCRVIPNGADPIEVRLHPDVRRKSVVELPAAISIKELRIEVLELHDGLLGRDPVGFAEVELQRRDG